MFGQDDFLRRRSFCTGSGQSSGDHHHETVRLEFSLGAVCGAIVGVSRGMRVLVSRTRCQTWLASVAAQYALD